MTYRAKCQARRERKQRELVDVIEVWRLPTSPEADDGEHYLVLPKGGEK